MTAEHYWMATTGLLCHPVQQPDTRPQWQREGLALPRYDYDWRIEAHAATRQQESVRREKVLCSLGLPPCRG